MSMLAEITAVAARRPAANATTTELATWYGRLGLMHDHLADDAAWSGREAEAKAEIELADRAYQHANQLNAGTVTR